MKNAVVVLAIAFQAAAFAQPGTPDASFGTNGFAVHSEQITHSGANDIVLQDDGKIIACGPNNDDATAFSVARLNSDGTFDNTFGLYGIVSTPIASCWGASDLALQDDGKIVATGSVFSGLDSGFAVVRYNTDGSLDNSFDSDGIVIHYLGNFGTFQHNVLIQDDGKILITGPRLNGASGFDFCITRLNTDGSIDLSFDGDGTVTTDFSGHADIVQSALIQPDGKIMLVGSSEDTGGSIAFALARYSSEGILDNSFDGDGKLVTAIVPGLSSAQTVAMHGSQYVVGGNAYNGTNFDFAVHRYNADGTTDATFGTGGTVIMDPNNHHDKMYELAVQSDGKIVFVGRAEDVFAPWDFFVARLHEDGTPDSTFDGDGMVFNDLIGGDEARCVTIQPDGNILAGGTSGDGIYWFLTVARYYGSAFAEATPTISTIGFSVFPNPAADEITIQFNNSSSDAAVKITDHTGRVILEENNLDGSTFKTDFSNQPAGIYFVELYQNGVVEVARIAVSR